MIYIFGGALVSSGIKRYFEFFNGGYVANINSKNTYIEVLTDACEIKPNKNDTVIISIPEVKHCSAESHIELLTLVINTQQYFGSIGCKLMIFDETQTDVWSLILKNDVLEQLALKVKTETYFGFAAPDNALSMLRLTLRIGSPVIWDKNTKTISIGEHGHEFWAKILLRALLNPFGRCDITTVDAMRFGALD